ncbi:MAG: 50S ribosomal protein L25 [Actinobacteria bacterium]|nr:50S ribosomal protein L25 [Actinomycetota bacterium]
MTQVKLAAEPRTEFGKGFSRRLRAAGRVPAVIYGAGTDTITLSLDAHDLMLALKQPKVVLEVALEGAQHTVAPRDVQRHPFKPIIEHVDLVVLSRREIRERLVLGQAMAKAEEVATERELDPVAVQNAVSEILADEENDFDADQAIEAALVQVEEAMKAQAEAAAAAAAAEEAAAEEAGEAGEAEGGDSGEGED